MDDKACKKCFSLRRESNKWSEKNRALAEKLEKQGIITDHSKEKIGEARKDGRWDASKPPAVTEDRIAAVTSLLKGYEPAHTNFLAMSQSARKTYTRVYFDTKTNAGRGKRTVWMMDRLNKNLKPM